MKRVLVIDADPSIRLLYQEELVEEGYEVISSDAWWVLRGALP